VTPIRSGPKKLLPGMGRRAALVVGASFSHRYIRPEADLANVQPEYQGLPDATAGLLAEAFGPRLHSGYLYGSVVRGNAAPGRSDIDVIAVLRAAPTDEDRVRAGRVERALVERFPVLFSAGIGLTHLQELHSPAQRHSGQVFLRELAVCICGEDLRPGLPPTKPSAAVAAGFHADTHAVFARARETLGTSTDPAVIRRVCRMTAKKMVQVAFAVVMAREGSWARVLEEQAAAVGAAFPQWAEAARRAAEQGGGPSPMPVSSESCWTASAAGPRTNSTGRCQRPATSTAGRGDQGGEQRCRRPTRRSPTSLVSPWTGLTHRPGWCRYGLAGAVVVQSVLLINLRRARRPLRPHRPP
jgi:predicted nucleotidyltransferase